MFETGRKVIDQVRSMFDKPSTSVKSSRYVLHLGNIEETDLLGAALHRESTMGNRRALKKVLSTAICVDYPNDLGQTPLFCACARDRESTALLLLQWRANPNEKSLDGMTPCHATCYMGNVHLLGKLIEAGGDLRLHDNNGNSMRDWAVQNPDAVKRSKMLNFIEKTHMYAMAYSGDTVNLEMFTKYAGRPHKQTSVMEIMLMKTGNDLSFDNLRQVQSTGFGKVYLGNNRNGGIISVVPLINEAVLLITDGKRYRTGFHTYMEKMQWLNETVSVKKVKSDLEVEDGKDILIADAEFLGKLRHPNILLLMGICQSAALDRLMLVFEHVQNATLHHLLHHTAHSITYHDRTNIIHQICSAMDFIHYQSLMHCGLSSMAIYLVSPHTTKVGNFEYMVESIKADLGKPSAVSVESHGEFLYNWMSPELILGLAPHFSSDVYSFCCIIWEIFTREVPWANLNPQSIRKKIVDEGTPLDIISAKIPPKLKSIIGYGLELREEYRLNKFAFISDWLKSDQQPKFQRINTSQYFKNKSGNFADQLYLSSSLSSFPSSSSMKNEDSVTFSETWHQDKLDFSSSSEGHTSTTQESAEKFCISPSDRDAHLDIFRQSFTDRKFPSESDLEHQKQSFQYLQPIKPASHVNCLSPPNPPLLGNDSSQFQLFERNNSGKPFVWDKGACLSRDYTSQPQLGNTDESPEMRRSNESVRRMADMYQLRLNQHKLRQAILKGSMAPKGSCQDLETSSDSMKSACNRKTVGNTYQSCRDTENACGASPVKSNTPKEGLNTERQLVSENTDLDFPKLLYTLKETRNVCISCESKNSEEEDSENGPQLLHVGDGKSFSHHKAIRKVAKRKSRENLLYGHGEAGNDESLHAYRVSLQDIRVAHQKLLRKSLGKYNTMSSLDALYPPSTEAYSPDVKSRKYDSPVLEHMSIDANAAQTETQNALRISLPHSRSQLSGSLHSEVKIQDPGHFQHGRMEVERDSFLAINSGQEKSESTNYLLSKRAINFLPVHADILESEKLYLEIEEPVQSCTKRCGLMKNVECLSDIVYQADNQYNDQQHDHTTLKTSLDNEPGLSLHKVKNKQSFCSDDDDVVGHNKCNKIAVLNGILNVTPQDQTPNLVNSNARDSVSEHGTESSGSLNGFKDISPSSTLGEDGDKAVKNSDVRALDSRIDDGLKHSGFSEKNNETNDLLKVASAKTTLEVNGSCDFQFHEFYIDDDFDSAELQDISCSKVPFLDCNTSTRHMDDNSHVPTVIAGSVKEKAEFFLHMMNNVKLPVFPRILKNPENVSSENLQQSTLSADNAKKGENGAKLPGSNNDKDTLTKENGVPRSSEQMHELLPASMIEKCILATPRSVTLSEHLQCGKNYSVRFSTGDHKNKNGNEKDDDSVSQLDEDTTVTGDFEEYTVKVNEDLDDTINQRVVSESSKIHHLILKNEVIKVNNTEKPFIFGNKTTGTDLTKEGRLAYVTGEDSDSDKWVKNKVKSIQEKIQRRRARMAYIVSSDENSESEDDKQCEHSSASTERIVSDEGLFIRSSESIQNPLQRSDEAIAVNPFISKSKSKQKVHRFHDLATHRGSSGENEKKGSLILAESSSLGKKKHKDSKLDWSYAGRTNNDISCSLMHKKANSKEITTFRKSQLKRAEISSLPDPGFRSLADSSKMNDKSSTMSEAIYAHSDISKSNTEGRNGVKSVNHSGKSHKWTLWKSLKKGKESSSLGCKIISKEGTAKGSNSILRKPSSITKVADQKAGNVSGSVPSPVPISRSKFSFGHDSKLSDKVISFQGITDSEDEKSELKQIPSKRSISLNEMSSQKEQSFDSYEYENKTVKTWLERENFAEHCSLASSRLADHQSITSRVMEVQNMPSGQTHMPHEPSVPTSCVHKEKMLYQQGQTVLTSKQSMSHKSHKQEEASRHSKECLGPISIDSTSVKSNNIPERKSAGASYAQDNQFTKSKSCKSLSEKNSSMGEDQHTRGTLLENQTNDHCLNLDLRTSSSHNEAGGMSTLKGAKKKSHIGLHRFYVPRELYHDGCTARMNVQISPADPVAHRIITTIDPVSGQTETLLDQTVITHKLKSTMKID